MIRLARQAMGTRFELVIAHDGKERSSRNARAAGEEALGLIGEWHDRLSAFDPGSLVSRLNRGARAAPVAVDRELFDLLLECGRIRRASAGAFDVGVGVLMGVHGFRDHAHTPAGHQLGDGSIELDEVRRTVRLVGSAEIDLGGVAKGGALDASREALIDAGVTCALLHGGASTIVAIGAPPGGDAWIVRLGEDEGAARVHLRDASVSYSSARPGGAEHVMDPRRGTPSRVCEAGVCLGASALETDAWATALMVLGNRPAGMDPGLTSGVLCDGAWTIDGPARGTIELAHKEVRV